MKIEYLHASKFGNGAILAAEFEKLMAAKGVSVDVHHIRNVSATSMRWRRPCCRSGAPELSTASSSPASLPSCLQPRDTPRPQRSRDRTQDVGPYQP
jgi:hypothetical protein